MTAIERQYKPQNPAKLTLKFLLLFPQNSDNPTKWVLAKNSLDVTEQNIFAGCNYPRTMVATLNDIMHPEYVDEIS